MRPVYFPILAAMCWAADASAAAPDCAGPVTIQAAPVRDVEPGGVLILSDGRHMRLEGIRLPETADLRGRALTRLRAMAMAGPVNFAAVAPAQDRYGRWRAQGFGAADWMQAALLEQGLARVQIAPDHSDCAAELYDAEAHARDRHLGLWASPAYAPRSPRGVADDAGSFQLVEGRVTGIGTGGTRVFIDFGGDGARTFSAVVQPQDRKAFRHFDFDALRGRRIRVRGIVQTYRGRPEIALSNPAQIEMLE